MENAMEYQTLFNLAFGILGIGLGMFMNRLFTSLDQLRLQDAKLTEEITKIKVSLPTSYVTKAQLDDVAMVLFKKLDHITDKLDEKADKPIGQF
jgi:hypothetical protein